MLFVAAGNSYGQVTYTTTGNCLPGQFNYFGDASCWTKSPDNCNPLSPATPPVTGIPPCPVTVVLNHDVNLATYNFITNYTLIVNKDVKLTITNDITQTARAVSSLIIDGGQVNVDGSVVLASGNTTNKTTLRIQTINQGVLNLGPELDLRNDTFVEISGDGSGNVNVESIELGQRSRLDILAGGSLTSFGNTRYNGGNAIINVTGFFRTSQLEVAGGSGIQFNTFGDANVIVDNDLVIAGNSSITFGGNSEIDVGGNIDIKNGSTFTVGGTSEVFVCGSVTGNPNISGSGQINPTCRILPVDYVYIESAYSKESNAALLTWATSKEWENSRFEIERSVGGISDFVKVGEVQGMGWKDSITKYEYTDRNLPLIGGNIYYRLKQVDINGEYSLSKVMSVKIDGVQFTEGVWRAYPNPTDGSQFRISLLDPAQYNQGKITFRIIHPTSISKEVTVQTENEMNEALAEMVGNIPKGIFVVELRWGQKIEHIKVLRKR
jgi:hypothetical protein